MGDWGSRLIMLSPIVDRRSTISSMACDCDTSKCCLIYEPSVTMRMRPWIMPPIAPDRDTQIGRSAAGERALWPYGLWISIRMNSIALDLGRRWRRALNLWQTIIVIISVWPTSSRYWGRSSPAPAVLPFNLIRATLVCATCGPWMRWQMLPTAAFSCSCRCSRSRSDLHFAGNLCNKIAINSRG